MTRMLRISGLTCVDRVRRLQRQRSKHGDKAEEQSHTLEDDARPRLVIEAQGVA